MSTIDSINAQTRTAKGTTACRRLRREGLVPGTVYGHKEIPQAVSVNDTEITSLVRAGAQVVEILIDGKADKALMKDVQWDTFSTHILHVDFMRVDATERVQVSVPIHTRGTAPGVVAGGLLELPHHSIEIDCLALEIVDEIQVRVSDLQIGDSILVKDLTDLPPGMTILTPEDTVLVHIAEKIDVEAEEAGEGEEEAPAEEASS